MTESFDIREDDRFTDWWDSSGLAPEHFEAAEAAWKARAEIIDVRFAAKPKAEKPAKMMSRAEREFMWERGVPQNPTEMDILKAKWAAEKARKDARRAEEASQASQASRAENLLRMRNERITRELAAKAKAAQARAKALGVTDRRAAYLSPAERQWLDLGGKLEDRLKKGVV